MLPKYNPPKFSLESSIQVMSSIFLDDSLCFLVGDEDNKLINKILLNYFIHITKGIIIPKIINTGNHAHNM